MSDYLILFICKECGNEEYYDKDNLPGDSEYCQYCSACGGRLVIYDDDILAIYDDGTSEVVR